MHLEQHIEKHFGLSSVIYEPLNTPTNDVLAVTTPTDRFALKLYHPHRTVAEVQWEVDLIMHLMRDGAPVAKPVRGTHGYVEPLRVDGRDRVAALFTRKTHPWDSGSPRRRRHVAGLGAEEYE